MEEAPGSIEGGKICPGTFNRGEAEADISTQQERPGIAGKSIEPTSGSVSGAVSRLLVAGLVEEN